MTEDLRVGCRAFEGDEGVLLAGDAIRELAETFEIVELVADPWRSRPLVLELEAQDRLTVVDFPQSSSRLVPASANLHELVVQGKLMHPNDRLPNEHVANAIAVDTPRGWRIGKPDSRTNIDLVSALLMAVERATVPQEELELVGSV